MIVNWLAKLGQQSGRLSVNVGWLPLLVDGQEIAVDVESPLDGCRSFHALMDKRVGLRPLLWQKPWKLVTGLKLRRLVDVPALWLLLWREAFDLGRVGLADVLELLALEGSRQSGGMFKDRDLLGAVDGLKDGVLIHRPDPIFDFLFLLLLLALLLHQGLAA